MKNGSPHWVLMPSMFETMLAAMLVSLPHFLPEGIVPPATCIFIFINTHLNACFALNVTAKVVSWLLLVGPARMKTI